MLSTRNPLWLDTAARIAHRLDGNAVWDGDQCTWVITVAEQVPGSNRVERIPAGGRLYQGTPGISLFLSELYAHTGEPVHLRLAIGAARHTLGQISRIGPGECGFHSGRTGVGYALYRLGMISGESEWLEHASEVLSTLPKAARYGTGDVIGGAAGAIPVLLSMSDKLDSVLTTDLAIALGDSILLSARYRHIGWSWGGLASFIQDLTGYAHGASGYAHALLELFRITGDAWFRYGAEQALAYERRFYDAQARNWPDFRYMELTEYLGYGQTNALQERLRAGRALEPYVKGFMSAWCHGAPGIALTRFRAMEILGDDASRDEALVACETTNHAVKADLQGYSLCHGHLGNCESLLIGARLLERRDWLETVEERCQIGRDQFELAGNPWPCGTLHMLADPSLMLGEAGIGYQYLRVYDSETPSILCPSPRTPPLTNPVQRRADTLQRHQVALHFETTARAFEKLRPGVDVLGGRENGSPLLDVMGTFEAIQNTIESETDDAMRASFEDAFAVDRARFTLSLAIEDFSLEILDTLAQKPLEDVSWGDVMVQRDDHVTVLRTSRDWMNWSLGRVVEGSEEETATVIYWAEARVQAKTIGELTALVLEAAASPGTVKDIAERVAERVEGGMTDNLSRIVLEQVKAAYQGRLMRCVEAPSIPGVVL